VKVAGIHIGNKYVHVCIMEIVRSHFNYVLEQIHDPNAPTPKVLVKHLKPSGSNPSEVAEQTYDEALTLINLNRNDVARIWASGSSGKHVKFTNRYIPDAVADAYGVLLKVRTARTVIDIGAEEFQLIKIRTDGKVLDVVLSEPSTVGIGTFCDKIDHVLNMSTAEMSESSKKSTGTFFKNGKYAVFGEAQVISLIHQNVTKSDIARAVYDSIADQVILAARDIGLEDDIAIMGGMAKNSGFVVALKQAIGKDIKEPHNPEFVGAFGTAVAAAAGTVDEEVNIRLLKR
jgi:predicted CoA-substrate-specific enzyme activase